MTTKPTVLRAAIGAALAAGAVAAAIPALTTAQSAQTRELTVREKVHGIAFVHHGKAKGEMLARGDAVVTEQALTDPGGTSAGTLYTDCTNIGAGAPVFKATLQCLSTYRLKDGQVASAGVVVLSNTKGLSFPIVGGSGAYAGAQGTVTPGAPVKGYDSVDVLHVTG
jgi:hypothetical protein